MAKKRDLPGFAEKRKILFSPKTPVDRLRATGEQFLEAERYDDALEFFGRCDARDLAQVVADRAMEGGNVPLYMRAKKVLGEEVGPDEWARLASAAEAQGRVSMAYVACLKAGNEAEAQRLKERLPSQAIETEPAANEEQDADAEGEEASPVDANAGDQ